MKTGSLPVIDVDLAPLPEQPDGVRWPTDDWPTGDPVDAKKRKLAKVVDAAFVDEPPAVLGLTQALVVVQHGRIVVERYGPGFHTEFDEAAGNSPRADGPDTTFISWSMAKSMLQIAIGIATREHDLHLSSRAPVPEWDDHDDPRHGITWHHLLHMASGLSWMEEYTTDRGSDVISMLFGDGQRDMASYAASFPLAARPGTQFLYSSGTSNILARALQRMLGLEGDAAGMTKWLDDKVFAPIGMTSASPKFDDAGTWVASSYVYATARDFARFGLLALRGGVWDGVSIVDPYWIDAARRPIRLPTGHANRYGSHWWVHDDGLGSFAAHGYEGQRILCVPAHDLVVVRLGKTPPTPTEHDRDPNPVDKYLDKLVACFTA